MGCHSDPHVVKKEDQFQELSLSEGYVLSSFNWSLFLSDPDLHIRNAYLDGRWQSESFRRRMGFVPVVKYRLQICDKKQTGAWLHPKEAEYINEELSIDNSWYYFASYLCVQVCVAVCVRVGCWIECMREFLVRCVGPILLNVLGKCATQEMFITSSRRVCHVCT